MGLIDNTTYAGKDTDGFFSVALLTGDTKSKVRLIPNAKSTVKMGSLNLGNILQADACSLEGVGNYTLAQKSLEVCDIAIKVPICAKDYESNYLSESLRAGSNVDENFPEGFMGYLLELVAQTISTQTEALFWQGDTEGSPASLCDGLLKKFVADGTVIDVAAASPALSKDNIISEIGRMYDAVPDTISDKGKVVFFISPKAAKYYRQALVAANPALIAYNNGDFTLRYIDIELVVSPGMPTNDMVAAEPMNLWYGTDLVTDEKEIKVVTDPVNPKQSFIITSFKWGVNYGVGAEIVYYT